MGWPSFRRVRFVAVWAATMLAFAVVTAVVIASVIDLRDDLHQSELDVATLASQVESLGATPAVSAPEAVKGDKGDRGPQGERGPVGPGPSADQVRQAVAAYLAANPPAVGRPPNDAEIAAAVAAYCGKVGGCRGATGAQGPAGRQGESVAGPAGPQGEPGPRPTDDQVSAAVSGWCAANNGCAGPVGPAGAAGATGPQGPQGSPVGSWTFTFGLTEYRCSDSDGNGAYECTAITPGPAGVAG